jgi:hypothetical protein
MKMTVSCSGVGVRGSVGGASARSGRNLDQVARGQCGRASQHEEHVTPSHVGERRDRSDACPGSVGDWVAGPGDGLMGPSP